MPVLYFEGAGFKSNIAVQIFWDQMPKCTKKWTLLLKSAYSNKSRYQVSPLADNFDFLDQIVPSRVFPTENEKWTSALNSAYLT